MLPLDELLSAIPECRSCRLGGLHSNGIPGRGNPHSPIMFVAEAPGADEAKHNKILVGATGRELDKLLSRVGIDMSSVWLANTINCWPGPGNPSPKPDEVDACRYWLDGQIAIIEPKIVVALGAAAISHFLGEGVVVADVHGRPIDMVDYILYPTYHPAAALHNPKMLTRLHEDFEKLPGLLDSGVVADNSPEVVDEYPDPHYELLDSDELTEAQERDYPLTPPELIVAVDTETDRNGNLWCWSYSSSPGTAYVVMAEDLILYREMFRPPYTIVMHNAVFDLGVLSAAGMEVTAPVFDSMLEAHILESEGLGLKFLARTLLGMEMSSYEDVVKPAQKSLARDYLVQVVQHGEWPPAPAVEEMSWDRKTDNLKIHTRKPQPIHKKAAKILADTADKGADAFDRWNKIDQTEKVAVEKALGPMPVASIEDVVGDGWIQYSARDSDATLRLHLLLMQRLAEDA